MNVYYFTVMFGSDFRSFYVKAKTLSSALKQLKSEIIYSNFNHAVLTDWRVCNTYTLFSSSGKRSHRSLNKVVRGLA